MHIDELTRIIIGIAIKIHRALGPGLFESVYQAALAYELQKVGIPFEKEKRTQRTRRRHRAHRDTVLCDSILCNPLKIQDIKRLKFSSVFSVLLRVLCVLRASLKKMLRLCTLLLPKAIQSSSAAKEKSIR